MSVQRLKPYINGQYVESETARYMPVYDPSTGEVIAETPCCTVDEVNAALVAAANGPMKGVLFTTTDGFTFTPNVITVAGAPAGFTGLGIAFGSGDTFWAAGGDGYNLRQVSFDRGTWAGTVVAPACSTCAGVASVISRSRSVAFMSRLAPSARSSTFERIGIVLRRSTTR